jgi:uncharacterized delta-60 repeat protein
MNRFISLFIITAVVLFCATAHHTAKSLPKEQKQLPFDKTRPSQIQGSSPNGEMRNGSPSVNTLALNGVHAKDSLLHFPDKLRRILKPREAHNTAGAAVSYNSGLPQKLFRTQAPSHALHTLTSESLCDSASVSWAANYASGLVPSDDYANAVTTDAAGNVYVTGSSGGFATSYDFATIKYDASGTQLWAARYDGPGNADDDAVAITVDASGNVYVTGWSIGSGASQDYATIKYNSSGVRQWVARYDGPGNSVDYPTALAVDSAGNVYVTGWSTGSGTSYDYATVKYDSSGVQQWVVRYDDPDNADDGATSIALDALGNVYVTGESAGAGSHPDFATIKYDTAGIQQWVARYDGPGAYNDMASALSLDAAGNVYVTGSSSGWGTYIDYATIKYDTSGVQQWVARYNGPGNSDDYPNALAIDAAGNVYVSGSSTGSGTYTDYATIKYDTSGVQQWVARYDGSGNSTDNALALAVDSSGNVYVTGESIGAASYYDYTTLKYDASGVQLWAARYDGQGNSADGASAIAVDVSGNVVVTGLSAGLNTSDDYATVKYDTSGTQQWITRYYGPENSFENAAAIAVDAEGNVYVTGWSTGPGSSYDYATVKYDASGNPQWTARYDGLGNSDDNATAIAIDASGNVYVTGWSYGPGTFTDYATIKYDALGVQQWVARYDGPVNSYDVATAIAVDSAGYVYVTGHSYDSGKFDDYATIKYDASGAEQWVARYDGPASSDDVAAALALDVSGNVYVTGRSAGSGTSADYATVKYDASGALQWAARYDGPADSDDVATALAIDDSGNVYVTGWSAGPGTSTDYATVKYDTAGIQQWVARYDGPAGSEDDATALAVDHFGDVFVTGRSTGLGTSYDFATVKYDATGAQMWAARYDGPANSDDEAIALAVDASGSAYVMGSSAGSGTSADYATLKYDASGSQKWAARYDGPGNISDDAAALAIDASGFVYVTGSTGFANGRQYTTIKYGQIEGGYPYSAGWNMISLSKRVPDPGKTALFPTASSALFQFTIAYQLCDSLKNGRGYWLKFPSGQCIPVTGDSVLSDTTDVLKGWNMIGAISVPVAASSVMSDPPGLITSQFFGYGISYSIANAIMPGYGYWVKVTEAGRLILSASPDLRAASAKIKIIPSGELPPSPPNGVISDSRPQIPHQFGLEQNYPNPFNPTTAIRFELPVSGTASLKVYNVLGEEVATLAEGWQDAGYKSVEWNAGNIPSGLYFYRLKAGSYSETRKLMLLK